ncbi:hypothetical protein LguiA_006786 [Lonicera macranthoides]
MEVRQVLHMNQGEGATSYAKNSTVQRKIISVGKLMIEEAVQKILLSNYPESMGIADLGCSSGPNTLIVVSDIMDAVYATSRLMDRPLPEFRISLNDLPGNDFNDIFVSLPSFYERLKKEKGSEFRRCYISGVPGSFYGRLFPDKSLHFVHSSSSLHWLSQVPPALGNKINGSLNKGKIYISDSSPISVLDAYLLQFQDDFSMFLKSRSEEMIAGGRMVLSFMGRSSANASAPEGCYQWELLARALMTMASEGLVEEGKIDSFNAPYYAPSPEELKLEIKKEGSFIIDRLEAFEIDWDGGEASSLDGEYTTTIPKTLSSGERVAKTIRAVVESMIECHFEFGSDTMDELFRIYSEIVDHHFQSCRAKYVNLVISLIKKG